MITKSIERAQKKVEENNFGTRKRLLEYDDVMNAQRKVIYLKRKNALFGDRLSVDIDNMIYDTASAICLEYQPNSDFEGFKLELVRFLGINSPVDEDDFKQLSEEDLTEKVYQKSIENYKTKSEIISQRTFPVIKDVFENESNNYQNIVIPFTDGLKTLQVVTNLKEAFDSEGKTIPLSVEKGVTLSIIDDSWKENLRELDDLKQSVQNATYEQKDPLLIYKFESYNLFKQMMEKINKEIVSFLIKANLPSGSKVENEQVQQKQQLKMGRSDNYSSNKRNQQKRIEPVRVEQKVGRNEPCPCGSGKKYKQCHGK